MQGSICENKKLRNQTVWPKMCGHLFTFHGLGFILVSYRTLKPAFLSLPQQKQAVCTVLLCLLYKVQMVNVMAISEPINYSLRTFYSLEERANVSGLPARTFSAVRSTTTTITTTTTTTITTISTTTTTITTTTITTTPTTTIATTTTIITTTTTTSTTTTTTITNTF